MTRLKDLNPDIGKIILDYCNEYPTYESTSAKHKHLMLSTLSPELDRIFGNPLPRDKSIFMGKCTVVFGKFARKFG